MRMLSVKMGDRGSKIVGIKPAVKEQRVDGYSLLMVDSHKEPIRIRRTKK